ncbi:hypothetical protein [Paracoccus alcaliphilus]|nr:hypothetical protein [Paracoccus alcaliphilus]WCR17124.1 hypothetical protein JHW40_12110 [Paracoccus alcaliphilus]
MKASTQKWQEGIGVALTKTCAQIDELGRAGGVVQHELPVRVGAALEADAGDDA